VPTIDGMWDSERMQRLLENLIGDHIRRSTRGAEIAVYLSVKHKHGQPCAVVRVAGDSRPLPEAERGAMFERWRHVVEGHGGVLSLHDGQDGGSAITLDLPLAGPAESAPSSDAFAV